MQTLKVRSEFQRLRKGRKWVTPAFILQAAPREDFGHEGPHFGFTVSAKSVARDGPNAKRRGLAVDRNRARRRLREAVRLAFPDHAHKNFDYVIVGRGPALSRNFAHLLADMRAAFHKVGHPARSDKDRPPIL